MVVQEFLFSFCNYIRNCIKMKIQLTIILHIRQILLASSCFLIILQIKFISPKLLHIVLMLLKLSLPMSCLFMYIPWAETKIKAT